MVRGSRFIPALFREIEVNAVSKVQNTKEEAHDSMSESNRFYGIRNSFREQQTTADDKAPSKNLHAARHKKSGGMKAAAVKNDPRLRQPEHRDNAGNLIALGTRLAERGELDQDHQADDHACCQRRQHCLCHSPRRWRPEWLCRHDRLAAHQKERATDSEQ